MIMIPLGLKVDLVIITPLFFSILFDKHWDSLDYRFFQFSVNF